MAKNKKSEIPHYELLYIIPNKYTEDDVKLIIETINKTIIDNKGIITYSEYWGNKKLAYSIKNFTHGYYNLVEFDVEGRNLAEIDKILRMSEKILRHQIIKRDSRTEEEIKKEKEIQIKRIKENTKQQEEKEEKTLNQAKKSFKKKEEINISETITPLEEKKQEETKKKLDLKDLDDKLDKILETNDLL